MTSKTIRAVAAIACDRCGTTHPQTFADLSEKLPEGWGDLHARGSDPHRIIPDKRGDGTMIARIGGMFDSADICPTCVEELFAWWNAGKLEQDQSAPIPVREITDEQRAKVKRYRGYGMEPRDIALVFGYEDDAAYAAFQTDFAHELRTGWAFAHALAIDMLCTQARGGHLAALMTLIEMGGFK